jgi:hypothetical protein
VLVGLPQGVGGVAILFYLVYFISAYIYNIHLALAGLPQGVRALAVYFNLV